MRCKVLIFDQSCVPGITRSTFCHFNYSLFSLHPSAQIPWSHPYLVSSPSAKPVRCTPTCTHSLPPARPPLPPSPGTVPAGFLGAVFCFHPSHCRFSERQLEASCQSIAQRMSPFFFLGTLPQFYFLVLFFDVPRLI